MAKIYGNIATINNNHTIKVSIYNKNLSAPDINIDASHTVKFSAEPVEITQQQDNTFEHILKTQCKIRLVTKEWLGDYLFAANYSSIVVNVWVDNHCVFCGYVTPHTYNQSYAHQWEEVEINCVDILSTLKDRRLTDNTTYEELVAQSTTRPFSWFLGNMDLDTTTVVIPNFPDIDYQEAEMAWYEISWTRVVNQDDSIDYYGIEAEVVLLDDDTAMNTGNERQGELKTVTWIESTDTCIVDGVSYYKEYAHITVAGEDVNTGDWRIGSNAGGMPQVVSTENRVDGWTTGVLPQPFDFWEHYTTYNIYDNGMEIAASDGIGEQIPLSPNTTTSGSYYEFVQGSIDDLDVDEDTGYEYYKDYAWIWAGNEYTNSGQWQRGNLCRYPTGTHTAVTGWQYDTPPVAFEYYETISHYIDYNDGTSELDYNTMGSQIPLTPNTTTAGSYYEYRHGDSDDLDVDPITGYEYYKDYAWVVVNNVAEKTNNWRRGSMYYNGYENQYLTIEPYSSGYIWIDIPAGFSSSDLTSLSYSKDLNNWTTWTNDGNGTNISVDISQNEKLYLKGEAVTYSDGNVITGIISASVDFDVYGNIMSLLYDDNYQSANYVGDYAFAGLFAECTNIINANNLVMPATTLSAFSYFKMFFNCTGLLNSPILPATTLAYSCYRTMFSGCTSLTAAPVLPATTMKTYCYNAMFYGCTSLTSAPALPATTLADSCYQSMFSGCTSLTTAPVLSSTTLAERCYRTMFEGCTSLTTSPTLPATILLIECYDNMFYQCSDLSSITMLATDISANRCLNRWVGGVAASGTFTKAASMTSLPTGNSGIPSGWTIQNA